MCVQDALTEMMCIKKTHVSSVVSTMGASACYGMSWLCGREVVHMLWPDRLAHFSTEVQKQKHNMLSYMMLLRVTPVLPNTFINVASPMVDVPLSPFMLGKVMLMQCAAAFVCCLMQFWHLVPQCDRAIDDVMLGAVLYCAVLHCAVPWRDVPC